MNRGELRTWSGAFGVRDAVDVPRRRARINLPAPPPARRRAPL